jgi:hypothetical protein
MHGGLDHANLGNEREREAVRVSAGILAVETAGRCGGLTDDRNR